MGDLASDLEEPIYRVLLAEIKDLPLISEVVVESTRSHAESFGDLAHPRAVEPVRAKRGGRAPEDFELLTNRL